MLTLFLIITLTNFRIISGNDNNDTQFINSLPEKEKQEFLQKVEKRIQNEVPEVKTPELTDTNHTTVEVYEKRLEDQGKSIQSILRSEIDNLKSHHRRSSNDTTARIENQPHVDLTLRSREDKSEATRRKNEGNQVVQYGQNIPVIVQYQYDNENTSHHKSNHNNTAIKTQNTVSQEKNESKVDVIKRENVSLNTTSGNVNDSSIEHRRTGRRSSDFNITLENVDNDTKQIRADNSSAGSTNDTTTVSTDFYNAESNKTTNYALGVTSTLNNDSSKTQSVASNTLELNIEKPLEDHKTTNTSTLENNTVLENITEISSTNSSPKAIHAKTGVVVDTTAQYKESPQTRKKLFDTKFTSDEKTFNPIAIIDNVNVTGDSSTISDKTSTSTPKVDTRINKSTTVSKVTEKTNNTVSSAQISNVNEETRNVYHASSTESNSSESDTHNKEITETKPHLVPVYNYDPENAYYNNQKILKGKVEPQSIVEIKETHSTSTNLAIYSTDNGKSLRYKDVKERIILNNKIKQSSDLEDVILSDISDESSGDTAFIEKPLKHTLKKIRTKLYNKKLNDKSLHDVLGKDIITITEENGDEGDNGIDTNKSEKKTITELFTNFGAVLQNLVDKANDNEAPTPKYNSKDDKSDSDEETYEDIANSLEIHNKRLRNKGIQRLVNLVKDLKGKLEGTKIKENKKKHNKDKKHQSRFHIKDRNGKHRHKQDKISSFDHRDINYPNFHVLDKKHEKSTSHDYLETHINSLKKLVNRNDASLLNYDWLGTTVLIRAGLEKLQNMTERKLKGKRLHPLDAKLLEFVIDLYETAKKTIALQTKEYQSRRRAKLNGDRRKKVSVLPKTKKGKKINTLQRMYVELNKARAVSRSRSDVEDFKEALDCLNMCLNDLHTAIKQISTITTYKEQRWFQNIKQLYLETDKEYLEVFLHLVMARLMSLIEERAKKMTEDDNLMRDKAAVDRIEVEVVLAMRICMKLEGIRALK